MPIVTLEALLKCIEKKNLSPEKAWLIVTARSVMQVTELPRSGLSQTPLKDRLHGLTSYVRVDELLDIIRWKYPFCADDNIQISPLTRRMPDGSIQTDIQIQAGILTVVPTIHMFETARQATALKEA